MKNKKTFLDSILEKFETWLRKVYQQLRSKKIPKLWKIVITIAVTVTLINISIGTVNIYIGTRSSVDDNGSDASITAGSNEQESVTGSKEIETMVDMGGTEATRSENDRNEYLADQDIKNDPKLEESTTPVEVLETESNNSSASKIYSLNWERDENRNWKLKYGDHSYVKNGWFLTEGKKYYFLDGICASGWQIIEDKWYYFDEYTGTMVTDKWRSSGDKWYYLGDKGYMIASAISEDSDTSSETLEYIPDQTEDQSGGSNGSTLAFSGDFSINYDQEMREFYIIGDISSDHDLKNITYTYCTPYEKFSDTISLGYDEISRFDLFELSYLINDISYSRREDIDGDYIFIVAATDCSGNSISGGLLWVFKDDQILPFELGQTVDW